MWGESEEGAEERVEEGEWWRGESGESGRGRVEEGEW